jgi:hypothetical protein
MERAGQTLVEGNFLERCLVGSDCNLLKSHTPFSSISKNQSQDFQSMAVINLYIFILFWDFSWHHQETSETLLRKLWLKEVGEVSEDNLRDGHPREHSWSQNILFAPDFFRKMLSAPGHSSFSPLWDLIRYPQNCIPWPIGYFTKSISASNLCQFVSWFHFSWYFDSDAKVMAKENQFKFHAKSCRAKAIYELVWPKRPWRWGTTTCFQFARYGDVPWEPASGQLASVLKTIQLTLNHIEEY